jgi:spore maturation protein CgeB
MQLTSGGTVSLTSQNKIIFIGLTITSSWGNGHATTYRSLIRELARRGHRVLFFERDMPWYASNRDFTFSEYVEIILYKSINELKDKYVNEIETADLVIIGSYVPEGIEIGKWVIKTAHGIKAFYDIDTPVTMSRINRLQCDYLTAELISMYDLYLSFAGGPILKIIESVYGSPRARPLYCSVDPAMYHMEKNEMSYDLGYMGTFSKDRQDSLEKLLFNSALNWQSGKFIVAGPQYPECIAWPSNVVHIEHVAPPEHSKFYSSQRFTLNLTRSDMIKAGYAPSVRLFEAAACGTPIISDYWEGLDSIFELGKEILIASSSKQIVQYLNDISDTERTRIGIRAQERVLSEHTAAHRALQLEAFYTEALHSMYKNYSEGPFIKSVTGYPSKIN